MSIVRGLGRPKITFREYLKRQEEELLKKESEMKETRWQLTRISGSINAVFESKNIVVNESTLLNQALVKVPTKIVKADTTIPQQESPKPNNSVSDWPVTKLNLVDSETQTKNEDDPKESFIFRKKKTKEIRKICGNCAVCSQTVFFYDSTQININDKYFTEFGVIFKVVMSLITLEPYCNYCCLNCSTKVMNIFNDWLHINVFALLKGGIDPFKDKVCGNCNETLTSLGSFTDHLFQHIVKNQSFRPKPFTEPTETISSNQKSPKMGQKENAHCDKCLVSNKSVLNNITENKNIPSNNNQTIIVRSSVNKEKKVFNITKINNTGDSIKNLINKYCSVKPTETPVIKINNNKFHLRVVNKDFLTQRSIVKLTSLPGNNSKLQILPINSINKLNKENFTKTKASEIDVIDISGDSDESSRISKEDNLNDEINLKSTKAETSNVYEERIKVVKSLLNKPGFSEKIKNKGVLICNFNALKKISHQQVPNKVKDSKEWISLSPNIQREINVRENLNSPVVLVKSHESIGQSLLTIPKKNNGGMENFKVHIGKRKLTEIGEKDDVFSPTTENSSSVKLRTTASKKFSCKLCIKKYSKKSKFLKHLYGHWEKKIFKAQRRRNPRLYEHCKWWKLNHFYLVNNRCTKCLEICWRKIKRSRRYCLFCLEKCANEATFWSHTIKHAREYFYEYCCWLQPYTIDKIRDYDTIKCKKCDNFFKYRVNLRNVEILTHGRNIKKEVHSKTNNGRRWICKICKHWCLTNRQLRKHAKIIHKLNWLTEVVYSLTPNHTSLTMTSGKFVS